ncbi:MAG: elongation factor P, partial [Patescibacteria group bacterium]
MADTTDIKKDLVIMFKDAPHAVVDFQHVNPGKGSAFVRTRLKNVQTGKVFEHTYKSGEGIEVLELERSPMQYLYKDADNYFFMDNSSFEQVGVPTAMVAEKGNYLKEGQEATVLMYQGVALSVDVPKKLTFKITEAAPGVKGDTASGRVTKEATIETGMKVAVPLFVKEGDSIVINTETG